MDELTEDEERIRLLPAGEVPKITTLTEFITVPHSEISSTSAQS